MCRVGLEVVGRRLFFGIWNLVEYEGFMNFVGLFIYLLVVSFGDDLFINIFEIYGVKS